MLQTSYDSIELLIISRIVPITKFLTKEGQRATLLSKNSANSNSGCITPPQIPYQSKVRLGPVLE